MSINFIYQQFIKHVLYITHIFHNFGFVIYAKARASKAKVRHSQSQNQTLPKPRLDIPKAKPRHSQGQG